MPFLSKAQARWGNSPAGVKALGKSGVKEWNDASKGTKLPERIGKPRHKVKSPSALNKPNPARFPMKP